jgi:SAM-dependent methyltransferase
MEKPRTVYAGVNETVLSFVPSSAARILDIGCGTGMLGERLSQGDDRYIVGITYSQTEAELASKRLSQVICAELNGFDFSSLGKFDCVVLSHVLEHLYFPDRFLESLKCVLHKESVVVVALPNVVWWKQRLQFLLGNWRYQDSGILDRTHFRFFDKHSSEELLEQAGYEIVRIRRDGPFPLLRKPLRKLIGPFGERIDLFMSRVSPGLFAMQFVFLARLRLP